MIAQNRTIFQPIPSTGSIVSNNNSQFKRIVNLNDSSFGDYYIAPKPSTADPRSPILNALTVRANVMTRKRYHRL